MAESLVEGGEREEAEQIPAERRWSRLETERDGAAELKIRGKLAQRRTSPSSQVAEGNEATETRRQRDYVQQQVLLFSSPPKITQGIRGRVHREAHLGEQFLTRLDKSSASRAIAETAAAALLTAKTAVAADSEKEGEADAIFYRRTAEAFPEMGQVLLLQHHINELLRRLLVVQAQYKSKSDLSRLSLIPPESLDAEEVSSGRIGEEAAISADHRALLEFYLQQQRARAATVDAPPGTTVKYVEQSPTPLESLLNSQDRSLYQSLMNAANRDNIKVETRPSPFLQHPVDFLSPDEPLDRPLLSAAVHPEERDLELGVAWTEPRRVDPRSCRVFGDGLHTATAGTVAQVQVRAVSMGDGYFLRRGGARFTAYVNADAEAGPTSTHPNSFTEEQQQQQRQQQMASSLERRRDTPTLTDMNDAAAYSRQHDSLDAHVYDHGDGTYTISYFCTRAVPHTLSIFLDDQYPVARSPYIVHVDAGPVCPRRSSVYGPGLRTFATDGEMNEVYVQLRDAYGNDINRGNEKIKALSRGAAKIVETRDLHDGRDTRLDTQASHVHPFVSLSQLLNEYDRKRRCGVTTVPTPLAFPPFPSLAEAQEALSKAGLFSTTTTAADVDLFTLLRSLLLRVMGHGDVGAVHHYIEKRSKHSVDEISASLAKVQHDLETLYRAVQYKVIDTLPVAFEIEDPQAIRASHAQRREALVQRHRALESKQQELRRREKQLIEERNQFITGLTSELQRRRDVLARQREALRENVLYAQRLSRLNLTKHLRREMLVACERQAVEAFKSRAWQRDFSRMLREGPLITAATAAKRSAAAPAGRDGTTREGAAAFSQHPPRELRPIHPDDPDRPATWLYKGIYCTPLEESIRSKLPPAAYRDTVTSPSCVTAVERRYASAEVPKLLQQQKKQVAGRGVALTRASFAGAAGGTAGTSRFSILKEGVSKREAPSLAATVVVDEELPVFGRRAEKEPKDAKKAAAAGLRAAAAVTTHAGVAKEGTVKEEEEAREPERDELADIGVRPPGISLKNIPQHFFLPFPPAPPPRPPTRRL